MQRFSKRPSAERLNGFSGDTHGDKESINPSCRARGPVGTFLNLIIFVGPGEFALVFNGFISQAVFPLEFFDAS